MTGKWLSFIIRPMNKNQPKTEYPLILLEETDSTNRVARELAQKGAPQGAAVVAKGQTAGYGRRGRAFFSPKGSGLYCSVILRPDPKAFDAARVTVTAAVAVAEAVEQVLGLALSVKWVNDLYFRNKKVCGILAQGQTEGESFACILGIGLNVYAPKEGFGELDPIAGALLDGEPDPKIMDGLRDEILDRFFALYGGDFAPCLAEYRRRSFLTDKTVTVVQGEKRLRGIVRGIDERGALLVELGGTVTAFSSGEIALEDYR